MTQIYSLAANGKPLVTVSMEIPDFLPRTPKLERTWLKGIITEQVSKVSKSRAARAAKPAKAKLAVA
jgi:hypothetical protein